MGAVVAGAAIALVGGIMQSNSQKKAQKQAAKDSAAAQQKASQWEAWSQERQRKWNLEDYQRVQNYKEDSIRGFAQFAPTKELQSMAAPERTVVDTSGLANFDPNDMTLNINNRKPPPGTPVAGGAGGAAQGGNGRALGQIR